MVRTGIVLKLREWDRIHEAVPEWKAVGRVAGKLFRRGYRPFTVRSVGAKIEKAERRQAIGVALLRAAERKLHRRKVKSLRGFSWMRYSDDFHIRCLHRAGYAAKRDALREQTRIRDLGLFLREMQVTLTARLADLKSPPLTIAIDGERLKAALAIRRNGVEVLRGTPAKADIYIRGDEQAIERMVLPISSPFEEYIQTAINVSHPLSGEIKRLLEALFPQTSE